jgi:hypothetical protein
MGNDLAQYCLSGHLVNSRAASRHWENKKFCSICGATTTTKCLTCETSLPGEVTRPWVVYTPDRPAYCSGCGKALPWTESAIAAAIELAKEAELEELDRTTLPAIIENLVKDVPQTPVAAVKLKRLIDKTAPYVGEALHKILVDVITEGAKKMIWPGA